mmetsp:Transcript_38808/g.92912  ORF Transcript_38808/g.92912 Transcript_38808/m.92912 type:complete len:304 (-) Transcript_38808:24-935(-)
MVLIPMLLCTAFMVPPDVVKLGITCAAGATGALCFYPLDLLKTRLQSSTGAQEFGNSFDAAMQVVATEGPLGLYNGLPVQLIGIMPVVSVQLLTNDALRGICPPVVAGMLTGLLQVSVSNPFEAIKVRLQLQGGCSDVSSLLGELGFKGLCRGWQGCAARDVTFSALTFPTYAYAKGALAAAGVVGPGALLLCGVLAASPAAFFSTPGDVISTRQKQGCGLLLREPGDSLEDVCDIPCDVDATAEGDEPWDSVVRRVYGEGGTAGFFRGGVERAAQQGPQMAVTLCTFDVAMSACAANGWVVL